MKIGQLRRISCRGIRLYYRRLMTSSACANHSIDEKPIEPIEDSYSVKRNLSKERASGQELETKYLWVEKIKFNSFLESFTHRPSYWDRNLELDEDERNKNYEKCKSVALRYMDDVLDSTEISLLTPKERHILDEINVENSSANVQFPYNIHTEFSKFENTDDNYPSSCRDDKTESTAVNDEYDDSSWVHSYGVPDPTVPASDVPCGGCGALLHCQDSSIPGYIPSERFKVMTPQELQTLICQRCFFLKAHDTALKVTVDPESYPEVLSHIRDKKALVLLLVDLTDFPCSIWPDMADIIGEKRPVILVGNKVDLLPRDSKNYLAHVKQCLKHSVNDVGLDRLKIIDTHLVSSSTGYGIEDLISSIYNLWGVKGDIYIMGCTNVGKSTLFNVFLQSDLCKVKAVDLVQRATVSEWPGTTLNLLKFPVFKPAGWQLHLRKLRLRDWEKSVSEQKKMQHFQLKQTHNQAYASLIGRVGRTFGKYEHGQHIKWLNETHDLFSVNANTVNAPQLTEIGKWNPNAEAFAHGKWCFDTPGTVNENQILDKLLLPELMQLVPKTMIQPRSFFMKMGMTMFVGGIARIDFDSEIAIRYTVFVSSFIPITLVRTVYADEIYEKALGTPVFGVPMGSKERLSVFPKLKSKEFEVDGTGLNYSCCDIVISAMGWVAVTARKGQYCKLTVHTPNGMGLFCRQPSLLPYAINLRGLKQPQTCTYGEHRPYVPNHSSTY